MAGGSIVDDFTGDGWLDIFTSLDRRRPWGSRLFVNRGDGTFEDRSAKAAWRIQVAALNCNHADYDNDGDLDILILLRGGWEKPLRAVAASQRRERPVHGRDRRRRAGEPIACQSAAWADYDNDGQGRPVSSRRVRGPVGQRTPATTTTRRPRSAQPGRLYRNNGDGTFTDVADAAGRPQRPLRPRGRLGRLRRRRPARPLRVELRPGQPPLPQQRRRHVHRRRREARRRPSRSQLLLLVLGLRQRRPARPLRHRLAGDARRRGPQPARPADRRRATPALPQRGGPVRRRDPEAGLDRVWLPMGSNFGDIDNDGFLDIYLGTGQPPYSYLMPNVLLHNVGGTAVRGRDGRLGHGPPPEGAWGLVRRLGPRRRRRPFLESGGATPGDKAHNVLFQNPGHGNHWLNVKLVGTRSNRAAIGAEIRVELATPDGKKESRYRIISSGSSFGGNGLATTIGLGQATSVTTLEIHWPTSGLRQAFHNVPADRALEITEGRDDYRVVNWSPIKLPEEAK